MVGNTPIPGDWVSKVIAVSGLNAGENPAPGIAVARSLREGGHRGRLIGLAYDSLDAGIYTEGLFDAVYMMPFPSAGAEAVLGRVEEIQRDCGLEILLPTLDSEMDLYGYLEDGLAHRGIATFLPTRESLALRSKARLAAFCEENGFLAPPTRVVYDAAGLEKAFKELVDPAGKQPVYVKGQYYEAKKAFTLEQAYAAWADISARWGLPIVLQQGLPGNELDVCCLGDGLGGLVGAVAMRKLGLTSQGKAWSGVTVGDPRLEELSRQMIHALRWRGPCELEILCHETNDQLYLIEINPRFPAWCYLCAGAGVNLPAAQAAMASGASTVDLPQPRSGVVYTRMASDQVCDLSILKDLNTKGQTVHARTDSQEGDPQ
ncbi:MAG: ATP-grasp domain-containing protein [Calditrichaeota bacterium]|nr:ATP-grasp domain-containing protein [Calditrichota bacterium]MCB9473442.1 ATP-grasp domain-containing protein [Candidatus Delongbacteria bacterium]